MHSAELIMILWARDMTISINITCLLLHIIEIHKKSSSKSKSVLYHYAFSKMILELFLSIPCAFLLCYQTNFNQKLSVFVLNCLQRFVSVSQTVHSILIQLFLFCVYFCDEWRSRSSILKTARMNYIVSEYNFWKITFNICFLNFVNCMTHIFVNISYNNISFIIVVTEDCQGVDFLMLPLKKITFWSSLLHKLSWRHEL